jgi:soluble lytic murein transglycosylase-like protein
MKKLVTPALFALLLLACAAPASLAQSAAASSRPAFDNFDFESGVRLEPTPAPRYFRMTAMHRAELARSAPKVKLTTYAYNPAGVLPMTISQSLDGFTTGDARVDSYIVDAGRHNNVDPVLLYAIMHRESAFKKFAVSPVGARGLMQLMPGTAARFGVRNIFDPAQNIEGGARYVRFLLDRFGDVRLALAGYNAGEGNVDKYKGIPPFPETENYVRKITANYGKTYHPVVTPEDARVVFHLAAETAAE